MSRKLQTKEVNRPPVFPIVCRFPRAETTASSRTNVHFVYLNLLEVEKSKPNSVASIREALSLAATVAYCRPFTRSDRKDGSKRRPWISAEFSEDLPEPLKTYHKELVTLRDKLWAHTDETVHDSSDPTQTLKKMMTPKYSELIDEVLHRLKIDRAD